MSQQQIQVYVIGAGYAGMLATVRLAGKTRRQNVQITLINPSERFVERLRLHQYAANQPVRQRPIVEILRGTGVHFVQAWVTAIDTRQREIVAWHSAAGEVQVDEAAREALRVGPAFRQHSLDLRRFGFDLSRRPQQHQQ